MRTRLTATAIVMVVLGLNARAQQLQPPAPEPDFGRQRPLRRGDRPAPLLKVLLRAPFESEQVLRRYAEAMSLRALHVGTRRTRSLRCRLDISLPARWIMRVSRHRAALRALGAPIPLAGLSLCHRNPPWLLSVA